MNRYLVFMYDRYDSLGGFYDFVRGFDDVNDAISFCDDLDDDGAIYNEGHVSDIEKNEIVHRAE